MGLLDAYCRSCGQPGAGSSGHNCVTYSRPRGFCGRIGGADFTHACIMPAPPPVTYVTPTWITPIVVTIIPTITTPTLVSS